MATRAPESLSEPEEAQARRLTAEVRRAAAQGAFIAAGLLVAVAAARELLDGWLLGAAILGVVAGAALVGSQVRLPERRTVAVGPGEPRLPAETILASLPDPVILVDRRAVVLEANDAARSLLPSLKARNPLSFALRSPAVLDGIEEALRTGETLKVEFVERVPTERTFEVQVTPLKPGDGDPRDGGPAGVLLVFRDLTSARRLEHMRVDFIANASHELRTPLASLLGFIETLQGPARNDSAARTRFLEIMREQAQRMKRLIDDLLSLSRIELSAHVVPQTELDLRPTVEHMIDALRALARERGVDIRFDAEEGAFPVRGDRDELLRVVENLIENALKYGESGGRVEVSLRRIPAEAESGRPQTEIAVRDYGPGIAPEHLPRLTERFYRVDIAESRAKGGTGLGLAIVKHIVARHRGRLLIESEPGEGATFRVLLPAVDGAV